MEHELVDALAFAEAHFALGRMHVHVHRFRRQVEEQHEGGVALVVQDVLIGLAHGVHQHLVAHEAAVDEEILFVARGARIGGQGGDAVEVQCADLAFDVDGVLAELGAEDGGDPLPQPLSRKRARGGVGFPLPQAGEGLREREVPHDLPLCCKEKATSGRDSAMRLNVSSHQANSVFSLFRNLRRAGVLKYSSRISTLVPCACAAGAAVLCVPSAASIFHACVLSALRLVSVTCATAAMLASASPRKPMLATRCRSSSEAILLVAWRISANGSCSAAMPPPLSRTRSSFTPPPSSCTAISVAPASRLFSSNSFKAEAGRSITSPAAIWLMSRSGNSWMEDIRTVLNGLRGIIAEGMSYFRSHGQSGINFERI